MSNYEPNTWAKGDVVTSAKLNHIENGIAATATQTFLVVINRDDSGENPVYRLNHTWQEIVDAMDEGAIVTTMMGSQNQIVCGFVVRVWDNHPSYIVEIGTDLFGYGGVELLGFVADSSTGYPEYVDVEEPTA